MKSFIYEIHRIVSIKHELRNILLAESGHIAKLLN